jgi:gas vesicle protein
MFNRKKKEVNYTATTISLVLGTLFGLAYALLSTKQTGKELQADIRKKADRALRSSKRKLGKEFIRAKKEFGAEFESQLIKTVANFKGRSKNWFGKAKSLVS